MSQNPRQLAFLALRAVQRGAFADVAVDKVLKDAELSKLDRRLLTELVYGSIRRQRTLDALIDQLGKKSSQQQPPDLRLILHLGLYQLRYLDQIPTSAAVNTTVELAKRNGLTGLAGFVNGLLRQYGRLAGEVRQRGNEGAGEQAELELPMSGTRRLDPLQLPEDPVQRLGMLHSYPDWIVQVWLEQFGLADTEALCQWFNQSPNIDLRVNPLRASIEQVESALQAAGIAVSRVPPLPQALRLTGSVGAIQHLPGFNKGWWTVQDSSAQLVSHVLDPQPGEVVIDACAAPGGKTTHQAELMQDQGVVWACDRTASRLKKLKENLERLHLTSIRIHTGDSRNLPQFVNQADRVLVDAPCSGLGTLHRHADARWRQSPESVRELSILQTELLNEAATWVKPGGILVYATCTLHPSENEAIVQTFLEQHSSWQLEPLGMDAIAHQFVTGENWLKILPYNYGMDGFFVARLRQV